VCKAVEVFGADRVIFGTDYGPVSIGPHQDVEIVVGSGIPAADRQKIFAARRRAFFQSRSAQI